MADLNQRERQRIVLDELSRLGMPGADRCVVQVQNSNADLVVRVRYAQLADPVKITELQPCTEHCLYGGALASAQKVGGFLIEAASDSLILLYEEFQRLKKPYPTGWPVIFHQNLLVIQ